MINMFAVPVGVAELAVLRDLHQPPADHLQLLRQLLHLLPQAPAPDRGRQQHHRPSHHVDLHRRHSSGNHEIH